MVIIIAVLRRNGDENMKKSKSGMRIFAAILAGLMIFGAVAGSLIYIFSQS